MTGSGDGDFDVLGFARKTLLAVGLVDWTVRWDHAKRRAGCCFHAQRRLTFSRPLFALYSEETKRGVVLHEVAHALAGPDHRHDAHWRKLVTELGTVPQVRLPSDLPGPKALWIGSCPRCGPVKELHSMPRRVVSCGRCSKVFDPRFILRWARNGKETEPSGAYAKELKRIKTTTRGIAAI